MLQKDEAEYARRSVLTRSGSALHSPLSSARPMALGDINALRDEWEREVSTSVFHASPMSPQHPSSAAALSPPANAAQDWKDELRKQWKDEISRMDGQKANWFKKVRISFSQCEQM